MPTFDWIGKNAILNHDRKVPVQLLEEMPEFSCGALGTSNLVVEGDSLAALKSLLPFHAGKVKCIYIDPPYNTGNENWVYNDKVNDPAIKAWLGAAVGKEAEDLSRHDKWLCMMYPRLKLLRDFLTPDGSIWVSIDDNESAHLRLLLEELFGPRNFVADIAWQRTYSPRNDSKGIVRAVEHILVFSRTPGWQPNPLPRSEKMNKIYKNPDGDVAEWTSDNPFAPGAISHQGMVYAIQHPITGKMLYPAKGRCWTFAQDEMLRILGGWGDYELRDLHDEAARAAVCGCAVAEVRAGVMGIVLSRPLAEAKARAQAVYEAGVKKEHPWPRFYFTAKGKGGIRRKTYLENVGGQSATNFFPYSECGHTDEAKKEVKALFGGQAPFDTPKPTRLLQRVLQAASNPGDLILDAFAGSGTTGHAVLKENAAHPGEAPRRFILVELVPQIAHEVTSERLRRAIAGYEANGKPVPPCPGAFRYCRLGRPLLDAYGRLTPRLSFAELARYIWHTETGTPLPADAHLDSPLLGVHEGRAIYLQETTAISHAHLHDLPAYDGPKVLYATASLLPATHLHTLGITFRQIPYDLRR